MSLNKELLELLRNSKKTYDNYIINGKTFLYAKKIKLVNQKVLNLIKKLNFEKRLVKLSSVPQTTLGLTITVFLKLFSAFT